LRKVNWKPPLMPRPLPRKSALPCGDLNSGLRGDSGSNGYRGAALPATVSTPGDPLVINACASTDGQRRSGSAFTYTAFHPDKNVTVQDVMHTFRNVSASGRWRDSSFCPACGITMISRLEVFQGATGIPVGTFMDGGYPSPEAFCWARQKHGWYTAEKNGFTIAENSKPPTLDGRRRF
jgi:hypothetical protein